MAKELNAWTVDIAGDLPGHSLTLMECAYPDCFDGGYSVALPTQCGTHGRTIWWCFNTQALWCDGGAPEWDYHLWP